MMIKQSRRCLTHAGFTLLEILVALFIFTILSLIMARALHTVIQTQSETDHRAQLLRDLQMALLVFSRDVEQAVDRPVLTANGSQSPSFDGSAEQFTFTHAGYAAAGNDLSHSNLQRTNYAINQSGLSRKTWAALDQAPSSSPSSRLILSNVSKGNFQYLAKDGKFYSKWPAETGDKQTMLPQAVKINLTLTGWGEITQLYVIPVQPRQNNAATSTTSASQPPGGSVPSLSGQSPAGQFVPGQSSSIPTQP